MIAGCYGGTTTANVSWKASPLQAIAIPDRAQQIEVTDQLRLAHAAQQGKKCEPTKNSAFAFVEKHGGKWICHGGGGKQQNATKWIRAIVVYGLQDLSITVCVCMPFVINSICLVGSYLECKF
jgi:hypothetical protein